MSLTDKAKTIWTGGMAQVDVVLLCKCKALSSNPSTTKTKRRRETILKPVDFSSETMETRRK
jgi:hypothetical protein